MALQPILIHNIFDKDRFNLISNQLKEIAKKTGTNSQRRTLVHSDDDLFIKMLGQELIPLAKKIFKINNIVSSHTVFAHYENEDAFLGKHVDYQKEILLIDVAIYSNGAWGVFVDGQEYFFEPNCALAFESGKSEHWRGPKPSNNISGVLLCYYLSLDYVIPNL